MTTKTAKPVIKQEAPINLKSSIAELHKIYKKANEVLFNNELPTDIVLVIQSRGKRKSYGWMYTSPIWTAGEENAVLYEIGIASETMNRPYMEVITTLIHEMVHVSNVLKDVQDTSRNNTYHNKRFLTACEAVGMEYLADKPDSKIGYSAVTLKKETVTLINKWNPNKKAFQVSRLDTEGQGTKKKKSNIIKWQCGCGDIIRSSKEDIQAICGKCETRFVQTD